MVGWKYGLWMDQSDRDGPGFGLVNWFYQYVANNQIHMRLFIP